MPNRIWSDSCKHLLFWSIFAFVLLCSTTKAQGRPSSDWEKEIAHFEQEDLKTRPPTKALVFTGSSTIKLWTTLAQDLPRHKVMNRGFGGSQIADVTFFADRIIFPYRPKMVLLRSGSNDLFAGKSTTQVFADFKALVTKVHARLPKTKIVYISLAPSVARWNQAQQEAELNQMVLGFSKKTKHVQYLNCDKISLDAAGKPRPELFREDKLHFNAAGYELLKTCVRDFLR